MRPLPLSFQLELTADGSPTLSWTGPDGIREKMHHSQGALSESRYIYQYALREVLRRDWPVRILSMGLGLGYNEWLVLAEMLQSGRDDWMLWSFEVNHDLRAAFLRTLASAALPPEDSLVAAFEHVLFCVATEMKLTSKELKIFATRAIKAGRLQLREAFPNCASTLDEVTCVFYDAFSRQTHPELWTEAGLRADFEKLISTRCIFASYAATGSLNRALKALGFRLSPRAGFAFKRESTLAIRG